jgi:hypothetical protein
MKRILLAAFAFATPLFPGKGNAELDRPLKVEIVGSKTKPETHDVLLAYGRELSSTFQKLEDAAVYAVIELKNDEVIIAKIQIGTDDAVVVGELKFSQLSYLGLFMPDNFADAQGFDPKDPTKTTKMRFFITAPTDPESIKILKEAERGAIRNDDRVSAAEMRWLTGDWQETARHLELAGRDFFTKKDRVSQLNCKALEQIARDKVKK